MVLQEMVLHVTFLLKSPCTGSAPWHKGTGIRPLHKITPDWTTHTISNSLVVERTAVNRQVVGSTPTWGVGCSQVVRHRNLDPTFKGSNPFIPEKNFSYTNQKV